MNQELIDLPDVRDDDESDFEEDYNPFIIHHKQEPFHSFDRLFQNHFDIQSNRWIVIPRSKIYLLRSSLKKIKIWHVFLKKEQQVVQSLLIQNDEMKQKLQENQQLIAGLYAAERVRTDNLIDQIHRLKQELLDKKEQYEKEINQLKEIISEKDKKIIRQEQAIKRLNEVSDKYEEQNKRLEKDLLHSQKEFQLINNLKRQNFFDEKQVQQFGKIQTIELIFATKVKKYLLQFLDIQDYQNLMRTNKKLYLALIQHNTLIPHAIKALGHKYQIQVKLLQSANQEFKQTIKNTEDPKLKEIMIKQFDLKVNFTEFIIPTLRETQSLIDGDNFIGLKSNQNNKQLLEQLEGFLQQQALSYEAALKSLLQDKFPWSDFFPATQQTIQQINNQRKQFPTQSQLFAQQIIQRLYDLSAVCSGDVSTFGMFLSQLQKSVASLFVYSQHLTMETNQLQSLNYYLMSKIFFIIKEKKKYQDQCEDLQTQLDLYAEAKKFLNERVHDLENALKEKSVIVKALNNQIILKETQIQQNAIQVEKNNESIRLYKDKLKILAKEVMEMRRRYKNTCIEYNDVVNKFKSLKECLEKMNRQQMNN